MSTTFTLVSAQATAAKNIITLLTEARLLGQHKHTKLNEARTAILGVLSKCCQELNRLEHVTGKNLYNVHKAVFQMFGRAKWVDHNNMMETLESTLNGFILEYKEEAEQQVEPVVTAVPATAPNVVHAFDAESVGTFETLGGVILEPALKVSVEVDPVEASREIVAESTMWKSRTHLRIAIRWAYGCSFIALAKIYGWRRVREVQVILFK